MTHATSIQQALSLVQDGRDSFDLILLDISLPDGNGLKILPDLKNSFHGRNVPIIILSSDTDVVTKVAAFGIGADDYVSKPPDSSELRARIEARLRSTQVENSSTLQIGDLVLDSDSLRVELLLAATGPQSLELTPSEFKLLKLLGNKPGRVYTRDQLIDQVWGVGKHLTSRTVDAHISNLRKKLSQSSVKIETVTGAGYRATIEKSSSENKN